jgi:hypothetical protein
MPFLQTLTLDPFDLHHYLQYDIKELLQLWESKKHHLNQIQKSKYAHIE